jgi:hypothetical protein
MGDAKAATLKVVGAGTMSDDIKLPEGDLMVEVLTKEEMLAVIKSAKALSVALIGHKKAIAAVSKMTSAVEKAAKADKDDTEASTSSKKVLMQVGKVTQALSTHVPSNALRTGVAALNYVDTSYSKYKKA